MFGVIILSLFGIFIFHQFYWRRKHLPPGPLPLPFIGNLYFLNLGDIDNQILSMKKQYGNLYTLWLPSPAIIVGGVEQLRTVFIKNGDKVAGRPYSFASEALFHGPYGIVLGHDSYWRNQRRFLLQVLRDFGVGKPILEDAIQLQAADVCNYFKKLNGKPTDCVKKIFTACVGNIIFHLLFGTSEPLEDEAIHKRAETAFQVAKTFNHPFVYLVTLFPFLKYFRFLAGKTYEDSIRCCEELSTFYKRLIQEHRETINYEGEPRDYTDAFLMAQRKHNPQLNEEGEWSDKQLIGVVGDMFFAGIETTTTTLEMFVYYMIHNPEIQKKLYEELDRVIGKDKTIAMSDQPKLPYLNACLQEIQRITVVAPINLFHRTSEEITIDGYLIPKDTIIIPEFEMVHKDEKLFPDPWKFDPTRFLDAKNNFVKDDRLTPFSVGKRACVGEALARMELFIFAATFFHRFEFLPEEPNKLPKYEFNYTLTKNIKAFNCRIIERK